ncbi:Immune inhibitor A precursor [Bacillus thuringiensis serovar israelensis ATCC 35646]|nr:Immune inhibitor A precursor [Bacillus thuringiensis serovar israelensis ATCC 35646]
MKKKKKLKPLAVLTTAAVLSSTFAFGGHAAYAETPTSSLPIDEHLIPEERLAEALKQRGVIDQSASQAETSRLSKNMLRKRKGKTLGKKS